MESGKFGRRIVVAEFLGEFSRVPGSRNARAEHISRKILVDNRVVGVDEVLVGVEVYVRHSADFAVAVLAAFGFLVEVAARFLNGRALPLDSVVAARAEEERAYVPRLFLVKQEILARLSASRKHAFERLRLRCAYYGAVVIHKVAVVRRVRIAVILAVYLTGGNRLRVVGDYFRFRAFAEFRNRVNLFKVHKLVVCIAVNVSAGLDVLAHIRISHILAANAELDGIFEIGVLFKELVNHFLYKRLLYLRRPDGDALFAATRKSGGCARCDNAAGK